MSVFYVKHHEGYVFIVIVKLFGLVAELGPHFDDTVECLVGDHGLEPDVELEEGGGLGLVEDHMVKTSSGAGLGHIIKHASVEFETLHPQPTCKFRC